jgi:hypothetical protein
MKRTSETVDLDMSVQINNKWTVIGYDGHYKQPVLTAGAGLFLLTEIQRAAWDRDEEAFTDSELTKINEAVKYLIPQGVTK